MKITIRNSFHETETTTHVEDDMSISRRRVLDIRRRLCGLTDCRCGAGDLKERASLYAFAIVDNAGNRLEFLSHGDPRTGGRFRYV